MNSLFIKPSWVPLLRKGYPWIPARALQKSTFSGTAGELVMVKDPSTTVPLAIGYYNPFTQLACRILSWDPHSLINEAFFETQFKKALYFRERRFTRPFYRLIHAEGDGLPGLVIDRFDNTFVCQTSTAGMERLKPIWLSALQKCFSPDRIICRDDIPLRKKEGLPLSIDAALGDLNVPILIEENQLQFFADPKKSQKTGWFFDQRANRFWLSQRARHKSVLDLYAYTGGFGIAAAAGGAHAVTLVDSSENALALARQAAEKNQVRSRCTFINEDVFDFAESNTHKQHFDIVIADPPAFIKQAHHKQNGLRGYQKLVRLLAPLLAPKGLFMIASCSHHASSTDFRQAVESGITKAGRNARLIRKAGADSDHPVHPLLAQNRYLKSLAFLFS